MFDDDRDGGCWVIAVGCCVAVVAAAVVVVEQVVVTGCWWGVVTIRGRSGHAE